MPIEAEADSIRKETMVYQPELFAKVCTICGKPFKTNRSTQERCSWECRQEHNRQQAKFYARYHRNTGRKYPPCIICGFDATTDQHREGGEVYTLCPNHHCMITRNIKTLRELLLTIK